MLTTKPSVLEKIESDLAQSLVDLILRLDAQEHVAVSEVDNAND